MFLKGKSTRSMFFTLDFCFSVYHFPLRRFEIFFAVFFFFYEIVFILGMYKYVSFIIKKNQFEKQIFLLPFMINTPFRY